MIGNRKEQITIYKMLVRFKSDDKGQFVTTLGDDEITPSLQSGKNPKFSSDSTIMPNALRPNVRVARDTIRPSIGKNFYSSRK